MFLKNIQTIAQAPSDLISTIRYDEIKKDTEKRCLSKFLITEVAPRLLNIAQLLVSAIALPIILLVGLAEAAFQLCTCKGEAKKVLKLMVASFERHLLIFIPTSLAGIFLPFKRTIALANTLENCANPLINCLYTKKRGSELEEGECPPSNPLSDVEDLHVDILAENPDLGKSLVMDGSMILENSPPASLSNSFVTPMLPLRSSSDPGRGESNREPGEAGSKSNSSGVNTPGRLSDFDSEEEEDMRHPLGRLHNPLIHSQHFAPQIAEEPAQL